MIFKQYENGSCDIVFSKEEIKIINKKECIHLSDEALKHFGDHLMNVIVQWQIKFDDKVKNSLTYKNTEIIPNLKK
jgi:hypothetical protein